MTLKTTLTLLIALGLALVIGLQLAESPSEPGPTTHQGAPEQARTAQNPTGDPEGVGESVTVPGRENTPGFTYRRPQPGDPEYADYQAMLSHERYARFVHEGSKPPFYDPEWRAPIDGRREVPVNDLSLIGGIPSRRELAEFLLMALHEEDAETIDQLRLNREEFQVLCWPEFPQSRPYMRIPADEAWTMHFANMRKGARKTLNKIGGRNFSLVDVRAGGVQEYTNFRLLTEVVLTVEGPDGTRETLNCISTIIECRGEFKVFMFNENFDYEAEEEDV